MKWVKNMTLMGMGVGMVLLYQKYQKPVVKEMNKATKQMKKTLKNNMLDDMN